MVVILLAGVISDWKSCRVRNEIIIIGWFIGILGIWWNPEITNPFIGGILPIILLWPLFWLSMLGAGDIKLLSVIGTFYGSHFVLRNLIAAFFVGAVISIIHIAYYGNLKIRIHYLVNFIRNYLKTGEINAYYQMERDGKEPVIHFTVAIFAGFLLCIFQIYFGIC